MDIYCKAKKLQILPDRIRYIHPESHYFNENSNNNFQSHEKSDDNCDTRSFLSAAEQKSIVDFLTLLQDTGKKRLLEEWTYSAPKKWMRPRKVPENIQFECCSKYTKDINGHRTPLMYPPMVYRYPILDIFNGIIRQLVRDHVLPPTCVPEGCIVNIYEEGDCIPPHIDNHDFVRPFCTVSFLSECIIAFGSNLKAVGAGEFETSISIPLPVGSVLLNGNGADVARHCVLAVPTKRISITFSRMDVSKPLQGIRSNGSIANGQLKRQNHGRDSRIGSMESAVRAFEEKLGNGISLCLFGRKRRQ